MKITYSGALFIILMSLFAVVAGVVIQHALQSSHTDPNLVTSLGRAFATY